MNLFGPWGAAAREAVRALMLVGLLLLAPASAFAHAKLLRSLPKSQATLDTPPKMVELWFTDELSPGFSNIEVTDAAGARVDRGEIIHTEGGKKVQVELVDLLAGIYTVVWKVVSADEHTIRGRFTFKVTAAASPTGAGVEAAQATPSIEGSRPKQPAPAAAGTEEQPDTAGESAITWLDHLIRWLAYLAMMTLLGGFATRLFVIGPAFAGVRGEMGGRGADAAAAGVGRSVWLLRTASMILLPAQLAALVLQSAAVNDVGFAEALSPARLGRVITQTGYGTAWFVTTMAAAAAYLLGRRGREGSTVGRKGLWWGGLLTCALMFVGPSLTGHAMAAAREHQWAVVADWLHLVAGGFWVGGLFHLALALPAALACLDGAERGRAVGRTIKLFTKVALPSVVVVSLAGLYNSWLHLGGFGALWGTAYGKTLLVKLLLIAPMLLLGAMNGFIYGPRAGHRAAVERNDAQGAVEREFLRSLKFEAALGGLVLLVAAALVFMTPGRNDMTNTRSGSRELNVSERGKR